MSSTLFLPKKSPSLVGTFQISGSKSESNRLLILNRLFGNPIEIRNLSNSDDTHALIRALETDSTVVDIGHAGTAMRFLTAYFANTEGRTTILIGSERMRQRPIGILVNALRMLDAEIEYLENKGFPPLIITGKKLTGIRVVAEAGISSQFISALMLIAPSLPDGLEIELQGIITSQPYLVMTLRLLQQLGIEAIQAGSNIRISPTKSIQPQEFMVESDWSSASYFYAFAALSETAEIQLNSFRENSLQGDAAVAGIFEKYFGVKTEFKKGGIFLTKQKSNAVSKIELDLNDHPDLAQTLAVCCAGLKIPFRFSGLHTLKIKETDRLLSLQNELRKIGAETEVTENSIAILNFFKPNAHPVIQTWDDHRMALSFSAYSMMAELTIENPEVVHKSYPNFWQDISRL